MACLKKSYKMYLFPSAAQLTANLWGVLKFTESNPRCTPLCAFSRQGQTQSVLSVFTQPALPQYWFCGLHAHCEHIFSPLLISPTDAFRNIDYFLSRPPIFLSLLLNHVSAFTFSIKIFCLFLLSFKLCEKAHQRPVQRINFSIPRISFRYLPSLTLT